MWERGEERILSEYEAIRPGILQVKHSVLAKRNIDENYFTDFKLSASEISVLLLLLQVVMLAIALLYTILLVQTMIWV